MRCPSCNSENLSDAAFCNECGAKMEARCPSCGLANPVGSKFCRKCGSKLLALVTGATGGKRVESEHPLLALRQTAEGSLDGERKTVTALFADIKGSMDLMEDIDPEDARAIVDPALKLMIDAAQHYGGYIVQSTGDGIFALFGAPVAHEDHPQRALFAALRLQEQLKRYSETLRARGQVPVQARVGLNTGEVVLRSLKTGEDHTETTPIGHAISLAARMQTLAPIGSIATTEGTRKLGEGYFTFKSLGRATVKGVSEPVEVYEVTGMGPIRTRLQRAAGRGYTKFVGRERELEAMKSAAEQARAGHGQIVAAIGEPGVGKSRLFFEFKATSQSGWLVLEASSVSHGKATAYLPLVDLLHDYFEIEPEDEPRRRRQKLLGKLLDLDRSLEDALPYLFALLGIVEGEDQLAQMGPQLRRRCTQDAVKRILLRESINQPLMLIFEDLHWIDEETQFFLNLLAEGIANAPVLLLVNYRPEYSHQWGGKSYYTQLRLDPLGKEGADEMLSALLGSDASLAPLKRLVLERTEGNPLFMEELVEGLFDEGALVRNGTVKLTRPLSQLKIPPTVQGILAARIDRLPPDSKELLQTLAVIGMEFPLSLAREVVQRTPEQLNGLLGHLQTGEFIYEQPAAADIEFTFKHALTHDVAYNSLLIERRKLLHERTAQAIEALYHEGLKDHLAELAYHYSSSNNAGKAVEYLCLAGEQTARRGAYAQALDGVEQAIKLLVALPNGPRRLRAELGLRRIQGICAIALHGIGSEERLQTSQRVHELGQQLGDLSAEVAGLLNVAGVGFSRGEFSQGLEKMRRCVELVEQNPKSELFPEARRLLAFALRVSGDLMGASSVLTDLMTRFGSAHQSSEAEFLPYIPWVRIPGDLAVVQHALGRPDKALQLINEALRRGRQFKNPLNLALVLFEAATLRYLRREPEAALEASKALITLAEEHGLREWEASGRSLHGWALAQSGQAESGILELEADTTLVPAVGRIQMVELLVQVNMVVARADRALELTHEALARAERMGLHEDDAELHRLQGEATLMRDSSAAAAAEECFRKAIEIARGQSAKWWELRATTSLARLLRDTNRRDEARTMLADIYNWFTEGFDTADLKDAKALLDELRT